MIGSVVVEYISEELEPKNSTVIVINGDMLDVVDRIKATGYVIEGTVITDPPYGVTELEWDKITDIKEYTKKWLGALSDILDNNTVYALFWSQKNMMGMKDIVSAVGMNIHRVLIWYHQLSAKFLPNTKIAFSYDPIFVITKTEEIKVPNRMQDVFVKSIRPQDMYHVCQKPVETMLWLVNGLSTENSLVIDPFAGTGSTGIACVMSGRNCLMIEKDKKYFDHIVSRLRNMFGGKCIEEGTDMVVFKIPKISKIDNW